MVLTPQIETSLEAVPNDWVLTVPLFADDTLDDVGGVEHLGGEALRDAVHRGEALSKLYATTLLHSSDRPNLLLVGAGRQEDCDHLTLQRIASTASRYLVTRGFSNIAFLPRISDVELSAYAVMEGALRGPYSPGLYKTRAPEKRSLENVMLVVPREERSTAERGALHGRIVGEAAMVVRDLVTQPPNCLTPTEFAHRTQEIALEYGLGYYAFGPDRMRELGMGSLLAVARGSVEEPRFIVLEYGDANATTHLALCGKGMTYDSGGYSLKTHEGLMGMKMDMAGAAGVIGGMMAIARIAPTSIRVSACIGAAENMMSGHAMRPGDVVKAMNGETIEILNTDAEGRLVLADVLSYAVQQGASHIVDFATLTGSAVVSLGHAATLLTGKPKDWVETVALASVDGLERAWPMPLYPEYREAMNSDVADIKNVGGRAGGSLTASAFLSDFVGNVPWAHMDIAGTAWAEENKPYAPSGATGTGPGVIVALARRLQNDRDAAHAGS